MTCALTIPRHANNFSRGSELALILIAATQRWELDREPPRSRGRNSNVTILVETDFSFVERNKYYVTECFVSISFLLHFF